MIKAMKLVSILGKSKNLNCIQQFTNIHFSFFLNRGHAELTTITNEQIIGELKWTELAIKEVLGVTPRLMRPVSYLLGYTYI